MNISMNQSACSISTSVSKVQSLMSSMPVNKNIPSIAKANLARMQNMKKASYRATTSR
jgi:hypothetical protein